MVIFHYESYWYQYFSTRYRPVLGFQFEMKTALELSLISILLSQRKSSSLHTTGLDYNKPVPTFADLGMEFLCLIH